MNDKQKQAIDNIELSEDNLEIAENGCLMECEDGDSCAFGSCENDCLIMEKECENYYLSRFEKESVK